MHSTTEADRLSEAIADIATRFAERVDEHAARHSESIHAQIDDFRDGAAVTAQTRAAVRSTLTSFAVYVRRPEPTAEVHVPSEAVLYAHAYVHRRFPLRILLRTYLLGHAELWRTWSMTVREADLPPAVEQAVLDHTCAQMFRFIDGLTVAIVEVYERERGRWSRSMEAIRADIVRSLLDEEPVDVDEAERTILYKLRQAHLAAVVWTAGDDTESQAGHHDVWSALIEAAGVSSSLAVSVGRKVTWGWFGGTADQLLDLADRLERWPVPVEHVGVALGEPDTGVVGFRGSHTQALHVRRVVEIGSRNLATAKRFRTLAIPALASMDATMASFFVDQHLGPLSAHDDASARLRATLAVYFEEGESPSATARRLGIHVNTVAYRLRQIEALLGHPATQDRLETQLALRLVPYLGEVSSMTARTAPAST